MPALGSAPRLPRPLLATCALALVASSARPALAADQAPRKLRHLLRYVAADYRYAVKDGQVTSRAEHEEQLLLLADARRLAARLPREADTLTTSVTAAHALVERKADERAVVTALREAEALLVGAFRLEDGPSSPPDRARGRALFQEHCAPCHGATGHGDTERARSLSPPPPDLHDAALGDAMSPLRTAFALELGIDGTSMVPFTFLSDEERWSLAFFVTGLRHAGRPRAPNPPSFSLPELAGSTDGELLDHLYTASIPETALPPILTALRAGDRPDTPLSRARTAWTEARRRWAWREPAPAREALLRGLHDHWDPVRGALVRLAPDAALDVEQRVVLALSALSALPQRAEPAGGPAPDAFPEAISELLVDTTRADLLAIATRERGLFARALATAWAFLVECGASLFAAIAARRPRAAPRLATALRTAFLILLLEWLAAPSSSGSFEGVYRLVPWSLASLATAVLSLITLVTWSRTRSSQPARPRLLPPLVLVACAAVAAGRAAHAGQLAGLLPSHALTPHTMLFPLANATWEAICSQAAFFLAGLATLLPRWTPGAREPSPD